MRLGKSQREKTLDTVAAVAAFDAQGRLLVLRRADGTGWNCPGGHLEPHEEPDEAATRELKEETGLDGVDLEPLASARLDDGLTVHAFRTTVSGDPSADQDPDGEADAFKWVDPEAIPADILGDWHNGDHDVILQALGVQPHTLETLTLARTEGSGAPAGTAGAAPSAGPDFVGLENAIKAEDPNKAVAPEHVDARIAALEARNAPALHFRRGSQGEVVPFDLDSEFLVHQNMIPGQLPWRVTRFAAVPGEAGVTPTGLVPVGHNEAQTRADAIRMAHDLGADIFAEPDLVKSEALAKADWGGLGVKSFWVLPVQDRLAMARNPDTDPAVLGEALRDNNLNVFQAAASNPSASPEALREAWAWAVKDGRDYHVFQLAGAPRMPPDVLKDIVYSDDPEGVRTNEVREAAAGNPNQDPEVLAQIVKDFRKQGKDWTFAGAIKNPSLPRGIAEAVFHDATYAPAERKLALANPNIDPQVLVEAAVGENPWWPLYDPDVAMSALANPRFPPEALPKVLANPNAYVRSRAVSHPDYPMDVASMRAALGDTEADVRTKASLKEVPPETLTQLVREPGPDVLSGREWDVLRAGLIEHAPTIPPQLQSDIVKSRIGWAETRDALVARPDASPEVLDAAMRSGSVVQVRLALGSRVNRPSPEAIGYAYWHAQAVGQPGQVLDPATITDRPHQGLIRRAIAASPDAPPDVVADALRWPNGDESIFEAAASNPVAPPEALQGVAMAMRAALGQPHMAPLGLLAQVLKHPNFPTQALPSFFAAPAPIAKLARGRYERTPEGYADINLYPESVEVRPGTERLRHLRDAIAQDHPNGAPKKALPTWAQQNLRHLLDAKGVLTAQRLDEAIGSQPAETYRVGSTTWTGGQQHSDARSKVFRLQATRAQLGRLRDAGVLSTFFRLGDLSQRSGHPATPHTLGWVRWTGARGGVHVDEVQSDFGQHLGRVAHAQALAAGADPDEAEARANAQFPPEHLKTIGKILFGGRPPGEVLHLAFRDHLRRRGWVGTPVAVLTPEAKALLSSLDPTRPLPRHFHENYREIPERFGAQPGTYGDLRTQSNPKHQGQPTLVDRVRKSCTCLGEALVKAEPGPKTPRLVVQHNLTAANVRHAEALGGLAAPSLAIAHEDHPLTGFGEITLVAPRELGDPERVPVFDADVYSPRHPRARYRTAGPGFEKLQAYMAPHLDVWKVGSSGGAHETYASPSTLRDEFERGGTENVLSNWWLRAALARAYLTEKGRTPEAPQKDANVQWGFSRAPAMQAFVAAHPRPHDQGSFIADDPDDHRALSEAFRVGVRHEAQQLVDADRVDEYAKEIEKDHVDPETGLLWPGDARIVYQDAARVGQRVLDHHAYRERLAEAVATDPDFEPWVRAKLGPLEDKAYMETSGGAHRAYNLQNVLKEMTRQIRAGEAFNYGLGTARSQGATRFKALAAVRRAATRKIVPEEVFEAKRDAMDDRFGALADRLQRYHGSSELVLNALAEAIGESYKRGHALWRDLKESGFEGVGEDDLARVQRFANDLVAMPTTYFEAKPQRAVGFHEFRGAVVPRDTPKDVRDILTRHGLDIVDYDPADDGHGSADRARGDAIRALAHRHDLHLAEASMGEALGKAEALAKMRGMPSFPRLGLKAYPHTPLITSPLGLRVKTSAMVEELNRRRVQAGLEPARERQYHMGQIGGAGRGISIAAPGSVQGFALHPVMQVTGGDDPPQRITGRETQAHEDLHILFNQVGARYGQESRFNLAQRLLEALPTQYQHALRQYMQIAIRPKGPTANEEHLAHLLNYVNNYARRQNFFTAIGAYLVPEWGPTTDEANARFDLAMFRAHRHLLDAAQVADESWLVPKTYALKTPKRSRRTRKAEATGPEGAQVRETVADPENILGWVQAGQTGPERVAKSEWAPQTAVHAPTPTEPVWVGADGVNVPAAGPGRLAWDRQYHAAVEAAFRGHGGGARLVRLRLPIEALETGRPWTSQERYDLYRAMARAGERLPPVVVAPLGTRWTVLDGHHRVAAARDEGHTRVDALGVEACLRKAWDTRGLHEDLVPQLDPLGIQDGPYEDPDAPTGPLHVRPSELRAAYAASPTLQALRPGLDTPEAFRQALTEPLFYNLCATARYAQTGEPLDKAEPARRLALRGNVGPAKLRLALEDPDAEIAALAARHPGLTPELLHHYLGEPRPDLHLAFLDRPLGPADIEPLLWSPSAAVRLKACRHANTTPEQLDRVLAGDAPAEFKALLQSMRTLPQSRATDALTKADLDAWLAKTIDPDHLRGIARALDPNGSALVDHRPQLKAHPQENQDLVNLYHDKILHAPEAVKPVSASKEGVSAKRIFKTGPARFMTKPYHERVIQRAKAWVRFPIQGWAEMTHQALYHAAGIGHLHQDVHVAEHLVTTGAPRNAYTAPWQTEGGPRTHKEPLLVIHMKPGAVPIADWDPMEHGDAPYFKWAPQVRTQARQVGLVDVLSANHDRHGLNLMYVPGTPDVVPPRETWWDAGALRALQDVQDGTFERLAPATRAWIKATGAVTEVAEKAVPPQILQDLGTIPFQENFRRHVAVPGFKDWRDPSRDHVLAIDHSRSFQYVSTRARVPVRPHQDARAIVGDYFQSPGLEPFDDIDWGAGADIQDKLGPTFDWWAQHRDAIVRAFQDQLVHIRDPHVRAHLNRNFMARVDVFDEIAEFGPGNFDWDGPNALSAPIYHPDEKTPEEIEDERIRQLRANAEAEVRKDRSMRRRQALQKDDS